MSKVAILGFSFRFPSTDSVRYWDDLLQGRDLVTAVEAGRWPQAVFLHPAKSHPGSAYTFSAGSVGDVSQFDADFFGISPREAALMDPQQRLLLELSWETLENAGVRPSSLRGSRCGVFIGIASADYSYRLADDLAAIDASMATGNTASIAANRLSYFYDLRGPSMAIDTACSSSSVAFHQACRSILSGESEQALVGGVSLHLHPYGFITFSKASMLSRQGRCRVFDASGDGYVRSEGGGLFLLKDYARAVADGDRILAVVAHSAVNTDGRKSGLTVPNYQAQAALLTEAYAKAGIAPADIDYIEAHGTGTAVGDPIEARALGEALGQRRAPGNPLLIGSVKSNLGHLEAASGVAGLVKALHCLRRRVVPATIGVSSLNPNIRFDEWNIEVATQNRPLRDSGKLIVGVNSFGFGGANAHVILESHEDTGSSRAGGKRKPNSSLPLVLSANSAAGLEAAARSFAVFLQDQPRRALYDIAYAAAFRRERLPHRAVVFGDSPPALADALRQFAEGGEGEVSTGTALAAASGPAFIYSGNGSQWAEMGRRLLQVPVFRKSIRKIDALFRRLADYSLEDELAGKHGEGRYEHTEIAQPALFALQVGVTELLRQLGVRPTAVAGHSVGEVAAAWACGALSLEAAVRVIYHRSLLQGGTKGSGRMTAAGLDAAAAQGLLDALGLSSSLCLAGFNSAKGVTIAGSPASLDRLEAALSARGLFYRRLDLDYAFHSPAMDAIEPAIKSALSSLVPVRSAVPFFSTVTGGLLEGAALGAEYWWRNVRQPVRFEAAIKQILATGVNVFVEIGPHAVLRTYLNDCLQDAGGEGRVIPTLLRGDDGAERLRGAAGQVAAAGAELHWPTFFPAKGAFARLPNYPWQRETHWHTVTSESLGVLYRTKTHPLLGYPIPQRELAWESPVDTATHPTLADHVIGEATVFPGTGFAELALAAALVWHPGEYAEIADLEIRSPLLLGGERSKLLRMEIDAQDGSFSVKAREFAGAEPLALHAAGRVLREPGGILLRQRAPALPTRAADFDGPAHEAMTRALGLAYGPAYRAIGRGWVEADTAWALFELPPSVAAELADYHLHPALLDSAFQLIIQILKGSGPLREGLTFVPTQLGRISFRAGQSRPHLAQARLLRRSPHSLLADITIFDAAGQALAFVKEARFRSVRLHKGAGEPFRHLECRSVPKPHPCAAEASALPFEQTRQAMKEAVRRCVLKGTHRSYSEEVDPLLDGLCSRFTIAAFNALADADGGTLSKQAFARQAAASETGLFLHHLMDMVQEDGLVYAAAAGWKVSLLPESQATAQDIWNSLVGDYPDHFKIIHAVGRVGMHLRSLLEGKRRLQAISPQGCSLSSLRRQVLGASGRHNLGKALRDLVAAGLDKLAEGQRLGILEMSEGPPLFALDICQSLDFDRGDYRFLSPSLPSLEEAQRLREKFPAIGVHSIGAAGAERPAAGEAGCRFHLALISTDFLNLHDALAALEYARTHLAQGASIVLLGQHPSRWIDFVFGGQADWWAESPTGARSSRQQSARFWQRQLEQAGFASVGLLEFSPGTSSGPYLLTGQLDAVPAQPVWTPRAVGHWLILADEQGYSAALAERLRDRLLGRGGRVRLAAGAVDIERVLTEAKAALGPVDGIVHLAGLNAAPLARDVSRRVRHQVERCAAVAALLKACEATQTGASCWIVTAGAMADTLPSRRPSGWRASASSLVDSALWGFVRTLANESTANPLRLVDLEEPFSMEAAATALDREFASLDGEQEVIVTGQGSRFVPRLRLRPRQGGRESATTDKTSVVRLGFQMPGQLRNLRWEEQPRIVPGEGELEVEVHATGLNFRDVMYALGMLSDEAIENGFAGPTLGLEFAGVVRSVGGGAARFAPGDRVVGFGPSSFGNRVVTQVGAAAHIPVGLSFEAAATIPSAFFTAYYALYHLARLGAEEKVLIHGAAGGVGIAAIQVAKWCGAEIFATAGSDEKRDFLRLLGVEHIYDSRSLAFADEILADTLGQGVDVVVNSLAGEAVNRNLRVLKPFGRFLELGKRDFYENTRIGLRPFRNNISYFGIDADQLMSAQPGLTGRLFGEVMALFAEGVLYPLPYHAFEAEDVVDAFRYMQQSKQIGKVVVTYRNGVAAFRADAGQSPRRLALSAEGAYLVTGGLAGFGLRTAQWLAEKGVRRLILISRAGPVAEEAKLAVQALQSAGVQVLAAACDVADKAQLQALLRRAGDRLGPLKGVVHAAMVIDDALIRNMDEEQIRRVFVPKILGAQNLHDLTLEARLDFFVLFSSATTLFGNPGQGNYVAANTWLEALARHRLGLGLPATSVLWGAIGDAGFLARNETLKEALQNRMGGDALPAAVALDALEGLLLDKRSGEGVLDFDWKALSRFLPGAGAPKFAELAPRGGEGDSEAAEGENMQRLLAELSDAELAAVFAEMLKQEVGEILRIAPDKIDASRSIYLMGLDSLMGVELAVALESRFGVKLPVLSLSESPTIDKLAARIITQLRGNAEAESGSGQVLAQVRQVASQHAEEVTEDAVARFAEDIQADAAGGPRMIQ